MSYTRKREWCQRQNVIYSNKNISFIRCRKKPWKIVQRSSYRRRKRIPNHKFLPENLHKEQMSKTSKANFNSKMFSVHDIEWHHIITFVFINGVIVKIKELIECDSFTFQQITQQADSDNSEFVFTTVDAVCCPLNSLSPKNMIHTSGEDDDSEDLNDQEKEKLVDSIGRSTSEHITLENVNEKSESCLEIKKPLELQPTGQLLFGFVSHGIFNF